MSSNFDCPRCGALTQYKLNYAAEGKNPEAVDYGQSITNAYLQCTSCTYAYGAVVDSYSKKEVLDWWPKRIVSKSFDDVPPHIASAASEAYVCLGAGAYRGAGALARAVVEATAKDKKITKGQIYDKVEALFDQGFIREHVKEAAHEIRHFGNDMAHGDFVDDVDVAEAEAILDLMSEVLNEVFQSPERIKRHKAARLAKKQDSVS